MMLPKLQFNFLVNNNDKQSLIFTNPLDIITTNNINEVDQSLNQVKSAIDDGYYVAGFVGYEAAYALYKINRTIESDIPLLWFGVFNGPEHDDNLIKSDKFTLGQWSMDEDQKIYVENVKSILQGINNNEIEQVNYTVPFTAKFSGSSYPYYKQLKKAQKANFNAYLQFEQFDILSVSPEKFFSIEKGVLTVRPMKGTIKRGKSSKEDIDRFHWLQQSKKNKIENDLITNLMKDELKKIATHIKTVDQYRIEKYPTVYQMTTALQGDLKPHIHSVDVLSHLFPCGSITGVPKKEAIEMIANKESEDRGVYCGTIGYFTPDREAFFNVAIRTVTIHKDKKIARYNAGGAITKQSTADEEYEELITKTDVLKFNYPTFQLLETILLNNGKFYLKTKHINRLKQSARYFNFPFDDLTLTKKLNHLQKRFHTGKWRVRLLLNENGTVISEAFPVQSMDKNLILLAEEPIDKHNVFHYHKTTERTMFDRHRQLLEKNHLDVLLWNDLGEITEFTIGNIVVELDGKLITPPVKCGLLPGTFREQLIEDGVIEEAIVHRNDLHKASSIWFINSVRKWLRVSLEK